MPTQNLPLCTAFVRHQRVAAGAYSQVAEALAGLDLPAGSFLVFDDATGTQVDYPWPAGYAPVQAAPAEVDEEQPAVPAVGRPKLGVVSREVTLLPRHWEWLNHQPGGASAALRRLIDDARNAHAEQDAQRAATEATYRFMQEMAGDQPGFEEACRALFAKKEAAFQLQTQTWPDDVQAYLHQLSRPVWPSKN